MMGSEEAVGGCFSRGRISLKDLQEGKKIPGDVEDATKWQQKTPPAWFEQKKFARGLAFFKKHSPCVLFSYLLSLILGFHLDVFLQTLLFTGQSSTPEVSSKRYFATLLYILQWYDEDVTDPASKGYKSLMRVRNIHHHVRRALEKKQKEVILAVVDHSSESSDALMTEDKDAFELKNFVLHPDTRCEDSKNTSGENNNQTDDNQHEANEKQKQVNQNKENLDSQHTGNDENPHKEMSDYQHKENDHKPHKENENQHKEMSDYQHKENENQPKQNQNSLCEEVGNNQHKENADSEDEMNNNRHKENDDSQEQMNDNQHKENDDSQEQTNDNQHKENDDSQEQMNDNQHKENDDSQEQMNDNQHKENDDSQEQMNDNQHKETDRPLKNSVPGTIFLSQYDMATVQSAFIAPVVLHPHLIGINATADEIEDYIYCWRVFGYFLGIKDTYNICDGSFDDVALILNEIKDQEVIPSIKTQNPDADRLIRAFIAGVHHKFQGQNASIATFFSPAALISLAQIPLNLGPEFEPPDLTVADAVSLWGLRMSFRSVFYLPPVRKMLTSLLSLPTVMKMIE